MPGTRLLIPLDGSALAERTLRYVRLLATLGETTARLVAVVNDFDETGRRSAEEIDGQRRLLEAYLNEREAELGSAGAKIEKVVLTGPPAAKILEEAASWGPTIILISTHGRSGVERWRLGSVADKVVRGSPCDTLVVGPHLPRVGAEASVSSILVPLDGSDLAEQALPVGKRLARGLGARIHLLRVVSMPIMAGDGLDYGYYPELLDTLIDAAKEYVEKKRIEVEADHASVLVGYPEGALSAYASRHGIDLVVMTTHGRGGLIRSALGSVTDRMLGGATPVLVVRTGTES